MGEAKLTMSGYGGFLPSLTTRRHDSNGRPAMVSPSNGYRVEGRGSIEVTIYRTHGSGDAFANSPERHYAGTQDEVDEIIQDRTSRLKAGGYEYIDPEVRTWDPQRQRFA